jgi:hypothetical protein
MSSTLRPFCLLLITLCLQGCAPMLAVIGYPSSVVQLVAQVERVKLFGDGASFVASSKTITDHVISKALNKDCKVFHVVTRDPVCVEQTANNKVAAAPEAETASPPPPAALADPETVMEAPTAPIVLSHIVTGD